MKEPSDALTIQDKLVSDIYQRAQSVAVECVRKTATVGPDIDSRLDNVLTSKIFGFPIMIVLLGAVLWITVAGANYPSQVLAAALFWVEARLTELFQWLGAPAWIHGALVLGGYRTLAWVVAVMLPPMAIFFPCFTLLEDLGYLARVSFNLDWFFRKSGAHGKQALTMAMGLGCNAAGVMACRIIDSPRERLIAIITNTFAVCNGRFPTLITLASFMAIGLARPGLCPAVSSLVVVAMVLLGIMATFAVSWVLSKTLLCGVPSSFILELPSYRRPQVSNILVRSLRDRTMLVLRRAVVVAAPAGVVVWILGNVSIHGCSVIGHTARFLTPVATAMGLDGLILTAFILGLPANEIVLPILAMGYLSRGSLVDVGDSAFLAGTLTANGWTWFTALNTMLFSVLHFPCSTTILTIARETRSLKWTLLSVIIPLSVAVGACSALTLAARWAGMVR
ncbi:MAG: nucleoside recognition domain-containing protein [Clostridia bacterium]|nr:nucleoside recognition domain-containing protein [Clostridia bacterium]